MEDADYRRLGEHLSGEVEQVAFLFTERYAGDRRLRVRAMRLITTEEFKSQSGYHVELADEIRPEVIKRAWDEDACLIEAHSHVDGSARFSWSDLAGFDEWVPHMRWRLQGRPYAALVFAPEGFDALVWDGEGSAIPVEALEIIGVATHTPTGQTHGQLTGEPKKKSWWRGLLGR